VWSKSAVHTGEVTVQGQLQSNALHTFSNICMEHSFHSTSGSHTDSRHHSAHTSTSVRVWDEEWGWGVMGGWVAILTTCTMCPHPHQVVSEKMWHSLCGWEWGNTYIGVSHYYLKALSTSPHCRSTSEPFYHTHGHMDTAHLRNQQAHTWAYQERCIPKCWYLWYKTKLV